jgi:hypothetical protein
MHTYIEHGGSFLEFIFSNTHLMRLVRDEELV